MGGLVRPSLGSLRIALIGLVAALVVVLPPTVAHAESLWLIPEDGVAGSTFTIHGDLLNCYRTGPGPYSATWGLPDTIEFYWEPGGLDYQGRADMLDALQKDPNSTAGLQQIASYSVADGTGINIPFTVPGGARPGRHLVVARLKPKCNYKGLVNGKETVLTNEPSTMAVSFCVLKAEGAPCVEAIGPAGGVAGGGPSDGGLAGGGLLGGAVGAAGTGSLLGRRKRRSDTLRERIPPDCLGAYDGMAESRERFGALRNLLEGAEEKLWQAEQLLLNNQTKANIMLGSVIVDGMTMIMLGGAIVKALNPATISRLIESLSNLGSRLQGALKGLAEMMSRSARELAEARRLMEHVGPLIDNLSKQIATKTASAALARGAAEEAGRAAMVAEKELQAVTNVEKALTSATQARNSAQAAIGPLESEIAAPAARMEALKAEVQRVTEQLRQVKGLREAVGKAREVEFGAWEKVQAASKENVRIGNELEQAKTWLRDSMAQRQELGASRDLLRSQLADSLEELGRMRAVVGRDMSAEIARETNRLASIQSRMGQIESTISNLDQRISNVTNNNLIGKLEQRSHDSASQLWELRKAQTQAKAVVEQAEAQLRPLDHVTDRQLVDAIAAKNDFGTSTYWPIERRLKMAQSTLSNAQTRLEKAEAAAFEMEERLARSGQTPESIAQKARELAGRQSELAGKAGTVERETDDLVARRAAQQAELEKAKAAAEKAQGELQEATRQAQEELQNEANRQGPGVSAAVGAWVNRTLGPNQSWEDIIKILAENIATRDRLLEERNRLAGRLDEERRRLIDARAAVNACLVAHGQPEIPPLPELSQLPGAPAEQRERIGVDVWPRS